MTFASGFASGINAYATVLILGLLGRFAHTGGVPEGFQRTDVLVVMGILAVVELVADKIPWIDSLWDTVSTFIRPVAGALIGALIAGASGDLLTVSLAAVGGVTALLSSLSKTGIRMAINTSPEPVTNWAHSAAGDITMASVASLAALAPVPAAVIAGVVLLLTVVIAVLLVRKIRQGWRKVRDWFRRQDSGSDAVGA